MKRQITQTEKHLETIRNNTKEIKKNSEQIKNSLEDLSKLGNKQFVIMLLFTATLLFVGLYQLFLNIFSNFPSFFLSGSVIFRIFFAMITSAILTTFVLYLSFKFFINE